jgi:uncharacterized membrane protein
MKKVNIGESLKIGWTLFMKRPWYLLGLMLAVFGLMAATSSQGALTTALSTIVYCSFLVLMLKHSKGETINFDDLFTLDQRWISFAFLMLIKTFFIILGFVCFIIPGVYLSVRWMFAEMLVVDKGMRPLEALRASGALTEGQRGKLFLFCIVCGLLIIVGLLFLIVGALVAMLVTLFASIEIYKDLQSQETLITESLQS